MRASKRRFCSSLLDFHPQLDQDDPTLDHELLDLGTELQEPFVLLVRAETHHVLDAGAVVPAPVEDDHFAGGGKVLQVALHVDLALFTVGRRREGDDPEHARADTLGDGADRPALAGPVTSLEHDDDTKALFLDPSLQMAQPHLELPNSFSYFCRFIGLSSGRPT